MSETETITFNLELNVEPAFTEARKMELLLYRTLRLVNRLCGSEDLRNLLMFIQKAVLAIRILHTSLNLLMSATTPLSSALALVGAANAAITAGSLVLGA